MKRFLAAAVILLLVAAVAVFVCRQRPLDADIFPAESIVVDGATRHYRLVVPHSLTNPAPVVFAFHGLGDSTESMAGYSRLDELASRNGFILVYPAARNLMWETTEVNAGNLNSNKDVRFFDQLLAHLSSQYGIDRSRVYAVGMSNGASFVQLLAVARSKDLAAVAAHSGLKPGDIGLPENPLPIMLVAGANDAVLSAMQSNADHYRSQGHDVEFVSVPGLGHQWSAHHNADIWNFLARFRLAPNR